MLATYSLGGKLIFALSCIHPRDWYCNQELSFLLMYWKEKGKSVCKCYPRAKFNIRPEFQALAFKRTDNETLEFLQTHNVNSPLNSSGYDVFILNLSWIIKQTSLLVQHERLKPTKTTNLVLLSFLEHLLTCWVLLPRCLVNPEHLLMLQISLLIQLLLVPPVSSLSASSSWLSSCWVPHGPPNFCALKGSSNPVDYLLILLFKLINTPFQTPAFAERQEKWTHIFKQSTSTWLRTHKASWTNHSNWSATGTLVLTNGGCHTLQASRSSLCYGGDGNMESGGWEWIYGSEWINDRTEVSRKN